jgi:guanine deaminase
MELNELMDLADVEAQKSTEPLRCGCVIAKDGEVIAKAYNSQRSDMDATAHDSIKAIREAGSKLQNKDLSGCVAFCSCEPCTMCLSALIFAKIEKVYYRTSLTDKRIKIESQEFLTRVERKIELIQL